MNLRTKLVLYFTGSQKSIYTHKKVDMKRLRQNTDSAAKLASRLFDSKIKIENIEDTIADGVPVRIYRDSEEENLPVILFYHGGGFAVLGVESYDYVCRRLCKMNHCVVVSVDYRLAPEHTFPAAHEDAFRALEWTRRNIAKYHANPEDLILAGDSAGGNLAACMAHLCKKKNIPVKAQILVYPWIDGKINSSSIDRNGAAYFLTKEALFWYQKQYAPNIEDRLKPELSPCYEKDFSGLAPAFVLTAELDPLLDEGRLYYEQLKSAGNQAMYKEYPQLIHGFFNMPKLSKDAMQAYRDIQAFISQV